MEVAHFYLMTFVLFHTIITYILLYVSRSAHKMNPQNLTINSNNLNFKELVICNFQSNLEKLSPEYLNVNTISEKLRLIGHATKIIERNQIFTENCQQKDIDCLVILMSDCTDLDLVIELLTTINEDLLKKTIILFNPESTDAIPIQALPEAIKKTKDQNMYSWNHRSNFAETIFKTNPPKLFNLDELVEILYKTFNLYVPVIFATSVKQATENVSRFYKHSLGEFDVDCGLDKEGRKDTSGKFDIGELLSEIYG